MYICVYIAVATQTLAGSCSVFRHVTRFDLCLVQFVLRTLALKWVNMSIIQRERVRDNTDRTDL